MTSRRKKKQGSGTTLKEFVTVAFAEDVELARQYKSLLEQEGIPVAIRQSDEHAGPMPGVAVMVPEDYLDEAHVLIESHSAYEDFYESSFGDDYTDYDEDLYDDPF